jgi:ribose transport system substrate-binding protein
MNVRKALAALVLATPLLVITACGSDSGSSPQSGSAAGSGSVSVDVGSSKPIKLKKGPLKVALIMLDNQNSWEQHVISSAQAKAKELGWSMDVYSAGFDVQKELNTLRTIATSGKYDAVAAVPIDGAQECNALTKDLPAANILVSVGDVPVCGNNKKVSTEQWQPGILTWVGGTGITRDFYESWIQQVAAANPGPQNVLFGTGIPQITVVQTEHLAIDKVQPTIPDFKVTILETDFTTQGTYKALMNYLPSHPDVTMFMSTGSSDMDKGAINAIKALGKEGQIKIVESGGTQYAFDQVKAGAIQSTFPYTPNFLGSNLVQSLADAQAGKTVEKYISDIPDGLGSFENLTLLNKDNLDIFTPEY